MNHGVGLENERICTLLYADDVVLISESELQNMLSYLNDWCNFNGMFVNAAKSIVMHFRPNLTQYTYVSLSVVNMF